MLLAACAPAPGPHLFPGLDHPTDLDRVSINVVTGPLITTQRCNQLLADGGHYGLIALNCLLNGCFVMGCANVHWFPGGEIYRCDIYAAFDADWIISHELEHCKGYADKLY